MKQNLEFAFFFSIKINILFRNSSRLLVKEIERKNWMFTIVPTNTVARGNGRRPRHLHSAANRHTNRNVVHNDSSFVNIRNKTKFADEPGELSQQILSAI